MKRANLSLVTVFFVLVLALVSVIFVLPSFAISTVNVIVDTTTPDGISNLATGVTHTQYSLDPWSDPTATAAGGILLQNSTTFQNQHIMGWGAENPEPAPGVYNWASLDTRVDLMRKTGGIPVITLCCSPDWMFGGTAGQTDWTKLGTAPLPEHEQDFADLAKQVALRYPDVKYFQVWNEFKGMWSGDPGCSVSACGQNRWDYERYTRLYNLVYDAILSVRPDAVIGGPYVVMDSYSSASVMSNPSAVAGSYGVLDQRPLDVITYWLLNKHGAGFITIDATTANKDNVWATDEYSAGQKFVDVATFIRGLDPLTYPDAQTLPIWWAEWYASPSTTAKDTNHYNAVMASGLIYTVKSGSAVPLVWQPQGDAQGYSFPEGIWTGEPTMTATEGQPTPFYYTQKAFKDNFGPGTQLYKTTVFSPELLSVLASSTKTLLVNKTNNALTVNVNGLSATLSAYQVKVIDTPPYDPSYTPPPTPTPTPIPDTQAPTTAITAPLSNEKVAINSSVTIQATASDNVAVTKVDFLVDGVIKCTDMLAPYTCVWTVPSKKNVQYLLQTKAYDATNNTASSATVRVQSR